MVRAGENTRELFEEFVDEAVASLRALPAELERFLHDPSADEAIDAVFRAVHSIKGNAAFFGFAAVRSFSHALENALEELRRRQVLFSDELRRALVQGFDSIEHMLQGALEGRVPEELDPAHLELLAQIGELSSAARPKLTSEESLLEELQRLADEIARLSPPRSGQLAQRLLGLVGSRSSRAAPASGGPLSGGRLPGEFTSARFVAAGRDITDSVRGLLDLFLAFERGEYHRGVGAMFLERCRALAQWAEEAGEEELHATLRGAADDFQIIFDSPVELDTMLLSLIWEQVGPQLARLRRSGKGGPLPTAAVERTALPSESAHHTSTPAEPRTPPSARNPSPAAASPPAIPAREPETSGAKTRYVRVREERLDELWQRVSGLLVACDSLVELPTRLAALQPARVAEELRDIERTFTARAAEIHRAVAAIRKVPATALLAKCARLARDLAAQLGKKLDVHLEGETAEIDKRLADALDAPLTHLIRNAVDHALERPAERRRRGLPETGNLWLRAQPIRARLSIVVEDDGRGIDPPRLRSRAIELGLLSRQEAEQLSDQQALELVFRPGFSTAERVSEVSGRGVGLDVVRTMVREHQGEIELDSAPGRGTIFRLNFPLRDTLVVLDGLVVRQSGQHFIVPAEHVEQFAELPADAVVRLQGTSLVLLGNTPARAVALDALLDLAAAQCATRSAVLLACRGERLGLVVDEVLGRREVVVHPVEKLLPKGELSIGIARAAGRPALVLSVPDLFRAAGLPALNPSAPSLSLEKSISAAPLEPC